MIEIIQTNIIDNTNNQHSLTLKKAIFCNFMERVTKKNIHKFYDGCKIFHVSPLNGKESIYRYIMTDGDYIVVREFNLLSLFLEEYGIITSLTESQIINCNFYFYEDEKGVIENQIEWHQNQINRLQEKIDTIYCD